MQKIKVRGNVSLEELSRHNPLESHEVNLVGAVGVFCNPDMFPTLEGLKTWVDQGVVPVIGYHPRIPFSESNLAKLKEVLSFPGVAGLGEIGIDRTENVKTWASQARMVKRLLSLLLPEHVLVIHCRGMSNGVEVVDEAVLFMLALLAAHPSVRREQLIHLHCYTGSLEALQEWIEEFPNTYVGFTPMVCGSDQLEETFRRVEISRLLLETDAPYFSPPGCKASTPHMIGWVAGRLATVRTIS